MSLPEPVPFVLDPPGVFVALSDAEQAQLLADVESLKQSVAVLLDVVRDVQIQMRGVPDGSGGFLGWPQLGKNSAGQDRTFVDGLGGVIKKLGA